VTCSFAVSDGRTFTEREREDALHEVQLVDRRSLTYRQVSTARSGRWRITKTYATDPARAAVLVDVVFESLTGRPYQLYVLYDPALSNGGDDASPRLADDLLIACRTAGLLDQEASPPSPPIGSATPWEPSSPNAVPGSRRS
jgi:glucoamylase